MKKDPLNSSATASKARPRKGSLIATTAMFVIVIFLWRDQADMKSRQEELAKQNAALQENLRAAHNELDFFKTGDLRLTSGKKTDTPPRAAPAPVQEVETLELQPPTVSQTAEGLIAYFKFLPTTPDLPERITLVVRVPSDTESKILKLVPTSLPDMSEVTCIVNAQGKLGMIEGSAEVLKALAFELTVSGSVKARVRGSDGILDFELDITPSGCSVKKL